MASRDATTAADFFPGLFPWSLLCAPCPFKWWYEGRRAAGPRLLGDPTSSRAALTLDSLLFVTAAGCAGGTFRDAGRGHIAACARSLLRTSLELPRQARSARRLPQLWRSYEISLAFLPGIKTFTPLDFRLMFFQSEILKLHLFQMYGSNRATLCARRRFRTPLSAFWRAG